MDEGISTKLLEYLQRSEQFLLKECPEIIQQAYKYHYISTVYSLILFSVCTLTLVVLFFYFFNNPSFDKYGDWTMLSVLRCTICGFLTIPLFISFIEQSHKMLKIIYAPKYFLIQLLTK
jgi:hypothetical protein